MFCSNHQNCCHFWFHHSPQSLKLMAAAKHSNEREMNNWILLNIFAVLWISASLVTEWIYQGKVPYLYEINSAIVLVLPTVVDAYSLSVDNNVYRSWKFEVDKFPTIYRKFLKSKRVTSHFRIFFYKVAWFSGSVWIFLLPDLLLSKYFLLCISVIIFTLRLPHYFMQYSI